MARQSVLTNDITDRYSNLEAWAYDAMFAPAILKMTRPALHELVRDLPRDASLLDVGCGGGQIPLELLAARGDLHVTGVDLSPAQVKRAESRSAKCRDHTRFEVGSALDLPFPDASFDAVLSITSIKHWPSPLRGMQECVRVLRPGGALLLIEVDRGSRLDTVRHLISQSQVPRPLRGVALPLLRTFIVGQGLDLDDFRELLDRLPVRDGRISRIAEWPGIMLTATRTQGDAALAADRPAAGQS
jgi:ubiquinone/menaquinone biosynthesis C-methylase UbiE